MKKIILAVVIVVLSISTLSAQSVEEIVTKNLNAIGGIAKLYKVKSLITQSTVKLQALVIENSTTVLVGKAIRSESKIMGTNLVQAFDGTTPWEITPVAMSGSGEPQVMPEETSKNIISQIDPFPFLDYEKKGTRIELLGSEKVKDKDAYHLKISPKAGAESEVWIDVTSGLASKLKITQDGQQVEMFFSNYSEIEGIKMAMTNEISNPVAGIITVDTKTVKFNTAIDAAIFKMPTTKN